MSSVPRDDSRRADPSTATPRAHGRAGRRLEFGVRLFELPLLFGLVIVWMLLWQEISVLSVVSGFVVAIVALRVFYLPPVILAGRLHPWWAVRYLFDFLVQLSVASWQVAWIAVRAPAPPRSAIIKVHLHTRSDFILTIVSLTNSLIPGSLVVEVDRFASVLYLHVLDASTPSRVYKARRDITRVERLLILAIGTRAEVEAVR